MKKFALLWLLGGLALPLCRAELEIQDVPPSATPPPSAPNNSSTSNVVTPTAPAVVESQPVTPAKDADTLKFRNGDLFHGSVLGVSLTDGVHWKRSDVMNPIAFGLDNVAEITLARRLKASLGPRVAIELTNGDQLEGELMSLDDKTLTFKTWYAGLLMIKRPMVERLTVLGESSALSYSGPTSLAEWKSDGNRGAWVFRKGALYGIGNGSIGHDVKLPDVANFEFDLAWHGQLFVSIGFGVDDDMQIYNSGGYLLQFNSTSLFMQKFRAHRGMNGNLGANFDVPDLMRKTKVHVAFRINKPKKTIALFLDGTLAKQWTETDEWCARGTGITFMSQGQGEIRISNISVSTWDGKLDTDTTANSKDGDLVRLNNGDKVSGNVKSISGEQVALATSFAEMNVPLNRVGSIDFCSQKAERARRNASDVRAFFLDGNRLTFALDKLDDENLSGSTENFGHLTAVLGAFSRVQFHIYEKAVDTKDEDDWGGLNDSGAGNQPDADE